MSTTTANTVQALAEQLAGYISRQAFEAARQALYAAAVISIEADGTSVQGLPALASKQAAWAASIEQIHHIDVSQPLVANNHFALRISWDMTYRGQARQLWHEIAVFQVADGKVIREQFFYS